MDLSLGWPLASSGQERLQVKSLFSGAALKGPDPSEAVRKAAAVPLQKYSPRLLQQPEELCYHLAAASDVEVGRHEHPPSRGHHSKQVPPLLQARFQLTLSMSPESVTQTRDARDQGQPKGKAAHVAVGAPAPSPKG